MQIKAGGCAGCLQSLRLLNFRGKAVANGDQNSLAVISERFSEESEASRMGGILSHLHAESENGLIGKVQIMAGDVREPASV